MERIAVDMDGVIANVYSQFAKMHTEEFGKVVSNEAMTGVSEFSVFPNGRKYVNSAGFFRNAPVMEKSQEVLEKLNRHYNLFIVSAAMEFPLSLNEKQAWLEKHFPFITWKQMVFCGSKEIICADIMIDDHFKNLDIFPGKSYLYSQPHNQLTDAGRHIRVNSWEEIEKLLLPMNG